MLVRLKCFDAVKSNSDIIVDHSQLVFAHDERSEYPVASIIGNDWGSKMVNEPLPKIAEKLKSGLEEGKVLIEIGTKLERQRP